MNCNLKEEIDKLTDNYGCDAYIEVSGADKSVQQGLDILTRLGRFVCFSVFKGDVEADWSLIGTQFSFYYHYKSPHLKKKEKESFFTTFNLIFRGCKRASRNWRALRTPLLAQSHSNGFKEAITS